MTAASLSEQVILVTGAANGIGEAVANTLAKAGATLILLDKDVPGLTRCYDSIAEDYALPALYPLDLKGATVDDYAALIAAVTEEFGRLDGLVHCAAQLGQLSPVEHQNPEKWAETLHINLTAPFLLTQACLPLLKQQNQAAVIFTSDDNKAKAYWAGYGISKAGIETLAAQLRDELENESRVSVHCITPEPTQTALFRNAFPGLDPRTVASAEHSAQLYLSAFQSSKP